MASETSTVASAERGSGMLLLVYPVVSPLRRLLDSVSSGHDQPARTLSEPYTHMVLQITVLTRCARCFPTRNQPSTPTPSSQVVVVHVIVCNRPGPRSHTQRAILDITTVSQDALC